MFANGLSPLFTEHSYLYFYLFQDCKLISCSNQVTESVPTPRVGKRYIDEISLCTECCYNDTCNIKGCGSHAIDPGKFAKAFVDLTTKL